MKCNNHPNVDAIESCARCEASLCGACADFNLEQVFCESCLEQVEAERKVESTARKLQQPTAARAIQPRRSPADRSKPIQSRSRRVSTPVVVILVCLLIIAAQQLFLARDDFVPLDAETRAEQLAIVPVTECIQIFQRIGAVLAQGNTPADRLRCDDSGASNIVTRSGSDIRVDHPQPDFYGYREIYVTSSNPEPVLIR